jgi:hypothetical protein
MLRKSDRLTDMIDSLINHVKLYSMATPGHPEPLLLENQVRIISLTPDLQRVIVYESRLRVADIAVRITGFQDGSSTSAWLHCRGNLGKRDRPVITHNSTSAYVSHVIHQN